MVAYFVRRILGGMMTWFLAAFLLYSFLISHGWVLVYQSQVEAQAYEVMFALDEPWPLNYVTWVYDPNGTTMRTYPFIVRGRWGSVQSNNFQFTRSGLLRGDFGYSTRVDCCAQPGHGTPVLAMYGIDLPIFFTFTLSPIFVFMLITCLQRSGRHPLRGYSPAQARRLYSMEPIRLLG
jgi:hypothetical protein